MIAPSATAPLRLPLAGTITAVVHHAANTACLDKNFAGVFIVWDRVFGTFAAAPNDEKLRYGLTPPPPSQNPLTVNFFEWQHLLRDVRQAQGLRQRLKVLLGSP